MGKQQSSFTVFFAIVLPTIIIFVTLPWQWIVLFNIYGLNVKPVHFAIITVILGLLVHKDAFSRLIGIVKQISFIQLYGLYLLALSASLLLNSDTENGVSLLSKKIIHFLIFILTTTWFTYFYDRKENSRYATIGSLLSILLFIAYCAFIFRLLNKNLFENYFSAILSGDAKRLQFTFYNVVFRYSGPEGISSLSSSFGAALRNTLVGSFALFFLFSSLSPKLMSSDRYGGISPNLILARVAQALSFFLVLTSMSRSNTIALLISILILGRANFGNFFSHKRQSKKAWLSVGISLCIVGSMLALRSDAISGIYSALEERLLMSYAKTDRVKIYGFAMQAIEQSPILGMGIGYKVNFINKELNAHNLFISSWLAAGIFGFIISLVFYSRILFDAFVLWKEQHLSVLPVDTLWAIAFLSAPLMRVLVSGEGDFTLIEWIGLSFFYASYHLHVQGRKERKKSISPTG